MSILKTYFNAFFNTTNQEFSETLWIQQNKQNLSQYFERIYNKSYIPSIEKSLSEKRR